MATNTYVALYTQVLTSSATEVIFTSIPQGYTDLVLVANTIVASGTGPEFSLQFNGDTTSSYSNGYIGGDSTTTFAGGNSFVYADCGYLSANSGGVNTRIVNIQNYSNTSIKKSVLSRGSSVNGGQSIIYANLWDSTSAITSIRVYSAGGLTYAIGSTFTLYGIAAAAPLTAKASGGTIYYGADGYVYHKFTSSGTFTPSSALSADVLVVGGGGGGGTSVGGGGGGGGLLGFTSQALTTTGYTVTVGAGGASVGSNTPGNDGTSSQFGALTAALGGGGGGSYGGSRAGNPGGSGGGGCGWTTASNSLGGAGTSGQGYAGGNGGGPYGAGGSGGGGGAGGVGPSWTSGTVGSSGGRGSATYSSWAQITGSGVAYNGDYYFAAGGPGVYGTGGTQASASYGTVAFGGTSVANSGQGGCGDYGYAGGSGIVIVRYPG